MSAEGIRASLDGLIALRRRATELAAGVHRRAREPLAGALHSPFRGRGMEYAESRPYSAGDDVRHVDWRVTARTGKLHSKLFHAERERVSAVLIEGSPGMAFGTRCCFKSVQAARVAALFAWFALAEGDRLAGAAFGNGVVETPPCGGRRGVLRLLEKLCRWQADSSALPGSDAVRNVELAAALQRVERMLRPGSHLLLLLDPRSIDDACMRMLGRLRQHHDVLVALVLDRLEVAPPPPGRYPVRDDQGRSWLDIGGGDTPDAWRRYFDTRWQETRDRLHRVGIASRCVVTDEDPVEALRDLLRGVRTRAVA